jgi:hypothetical protein
MHPPRQGRKLSASVSEQADLMDDSEDGELTPCKVGKPGGAPKFHVAIDSPPHTCAKQHFQMNKDALEAVGLKGRCVLSELSLDICCS